MELSFAHCYAKIVSGIKWKLNKTIIDLKMRQQRTEKIIDKNFDSWTQQNDLNMCISKQKKSIIEPVLMKHEGRRNKISEAAKKSHEQSSWSQQIKKRRNKNWISIHSQKKAERKERKSWRK